MNPIDENALRELLQECIPPVKEAQLRRDLWPRMLERLNQQASARVPWFDWALAGLASAGLFLFPRVIPALLYHL